MNLGLERLASKTVTAPKIAPLQAPPEPAHPLRAAAVGEALGHHAALGLLLQRVVAHGLSASGRYMTLQIPLPDRPGQLARVSELLAQAGANVIEVLHTRHGQGLQISEVILQLSVETRGQEHRAHVIQTLADAGYAPTVVPD